MPKAIGRHFYYFLAILAWVLLSVGAVQAQSTTVDLSDAALIQQGSGSFAKNCAIGYCHGSEGRAARGPDLRKKEYEPQNLFSIVHDGMPDTTMPAWKNILSEREIWAVVAYVLSVSGSEIDSGASTVELGESATPAPELSAEARKGRDLFFDLNNQQRCGICHKVGAMGSAVGPDLVLSAVRKSEDELLRDIREPGASIAPGFEQTVVIARDGERVTGIKLQQTADHVKIFDTASIPPPLRTFYQDQIQRVETAQRSSMPNIYGGMCSPEELEAIIAYLKSGVF